ncbi:BGTF surface domain-containing protein [Halosolutus halophilus]|uniref:BGTF surface domain-containing protein n=1 Tax=Halosolutus halophilus TaxID=1552990 RepID=UPI0022351881|nr:BGTF surface domain-containing protein [Halosolutus halophilus]
MTSETTYREKGRAAFLAALMVLSVVAMTASFSGAAVASSDFDTKLDADSIDEDDVWAGQTVKVTNLESPADLVQGDEVVKNLRVESGSAKFDTTDLDPGRYSIEHGESDTPTGTFWVNEHQIDAEFENGVVNGGEVNLTYEDVSDVPRNGEDVTLHISAEYDNESVSADDLEDIFGDDTQVEDMDKVAVTVNDAGEGDSVTADFSNKEVGDYVFTVEVADTTAEDTAEITNSDTDATANFDSNTYEEQIGDVGEFTVEHEATDNLWVNVTDSEDYYKANIQVSGVDDTENVTFEFNSYAAGHDGETLVTAEDDEGNDITSDVTVTEYLDGDKVDSSNTWTDTRLLNGDYELEVGVTNGGPETDAAIMLFTERSTGDMTTWVAPSDIADADDLDAETVADSATERDYVATGDYLVTEVEASGIYGYAFDGGDWTGDEGLEFNFNDTATPRYGSADSFSLSDETSGSYDIVVNEDEDTFYVLVPVNTIEGPAGETLDAGETWNASFHVTDASAYVADGESEMANAEFDVEQRNIELAGSYNDDERLVVGNSAEEQLTAETNVAPGTEGTFRLRATADIYTAESEVDADGVMTTTFDLSSHEAGENIRTVKASVDGAEHSTEGAFIAGDKPKPADLQWSVDAPETAKPGDEVTGSISVENGGEETGNASYEFTFNGETVDSGEVELEGGASKDVASFASTLDEAGEYSWELLVDGETEKSGTLTVEEEKKDDTGDDGDGDDGTGDDGDSEDDTGDDDGDDTGDSDGTPGFGAAVAALALLAAAMLALRRQN